MSAKGTIQPSQKLTRETIPSSSFLRGMRITIQVIFQAL